MSGKGGYPERQFTDLRTLGFMFDMDKETARSVLKQLKDLGYGIDVLEMGTQRKIKVNIQQFRAALLMEFRQHTQRRAAV